VRASLASAWRASLCAAACAAALSCGGGGGSAGVSSSGASQTPPSSGSVSNVASILVDAGPTGQAVNTLYTSVTVCVPGTSQCQIIDHIQVDTASFGLRILAPALTLTLPVKSAPNGNALAECMLFADGYSWGPVVSVDITIAGETASAVPVQVIGDSRYTEVPADCSSAGVTEEDTVATFGANGILGIGVFAQDCGSGCVGSPQPTSYYACTQTTCAATALALDAQVTNPVALFAADNNGTLIDLPSVPADGTTTITGSLIFGIDTRSNNASGNVTVLTLDPGNGVMSATFDGQTLGEAFIDTGSNGFYFTDASLPDCTDTGFSGFYCPASTQSLSAMLQGANGVTAPVAFAVANAQTLRTSDPGFTVQPELAGTTPISGSFDFGLPLYYGRRVFTALESQSTSVGVGPYVAF
jgi:hypothetical protein